MMRTIAALRAAVTVVMVLAGTATLLAAVGGSPIPAGMPSAATVHAWLSDPLRPDYVPGTIRAMAWLIWTALAASVVIAWLGRIRHIRWARLTAYLPGPVQGLAATLLGAATVTAAVGGAPAHAAAPASAGDAAAAEHLLTDTAVPDRRRAAERHAVVPEPASPTVTVRHGDTLWDIAADRLDDPRRWKQIHQLNTGRHPDMRGGAHIERGWVLRLPAGTPSDTARPASRPAGAYTSPTTTTPPTGRPAASAAPSTPVATAPATSASRTAASPAGAPASAHSGPARSPGDHHGRPASGPRSHPPSSVLCAPAAQPPNERSRSGPAGIGLDSGSWLDVGLATALAAAVTLAWAHRRRRYTPRPLSPDLRLGDPDLAPMQPVITQIRRRLHDDPDTADVDAGAEVAASGTLPIFAPATHPVHLSGTDPADPPLQDESDAGESDEPPADLDEQAAAPTPTPEAPVARPVVPTLTNPTAAVWPSSGLGLTGPGAESAARGFLAAALADEDPDGPPGRAVLPSTTAATLLGAAAVTLPRTPRLIVADDLAEALDLLEQQILHRSRLVYAHEVDTVAAMRAADPYEEPTPPLLLIADAANHHERTRIAALLAQGQRLDVHGILLGDWPAGDTVVVDTDGTTAPGDGGRHGQHPADVGRFAVLTPTETVAVITTLAEAHTGLPQPPPPVEAAPPRQNAAEPAEDAGGLVLPLDDAVRVLAALAGPGDATAAAIAAHLGLPYPATTAKLVQWEHTGHAETTRTDTGQTLWRLTDTGRHALGTPATEPAGSTPADPVADGDLQGAVPQTGEVRAPTDDRYAQIGTVLKWPDPETTYTSEPPPLDGGDAEKPGHVEVTVLGEAGIVATDPDRRPRRKALELLVYLAVHDGSATVEAILDDLMPEAPASKAPERLHTYVSDLRSVMRRIGGPATYLTHPHQRYTLNPEAVGVDLWRMRAAIREAHQAGDPRQRIDALQQAVDAYRGPLADGADYEWAEPYREAIRQQALDAHLALADALTGDPGAQARILEAAIGHSPYSEHLYQRAMRVRAALGHLDAIRTLRRALDRALAEIDAEPSDDTITLANELIAALQRPGRRTDIETTSGSN